MRRGAAHLRQRLFENGRVMGWFYRPTLDPATRYHRCVDVFAVTPFFAEAARAAAWELGLSDALPGDLATLAARLRVAPRRLGALLDALCIDGAVRRTGPVFQLGELGPTPRVAQAGWGQIAEVLRTDRPLPEPELEPYQAHLARAGAATAAEFATHYASGARSLVDLGGGVGTYTAAWLAARSDTEALLIDHPAVIALAAPRLAHLRPRVAWHAGDLLETDLGHAHDVALLANVLHLHAPKICAELIRRAATSLRPGGRLVVIDLTIESNRSGPATGVYFALNMALYTAGGSVYSTSEIGVWMRAAGLAPEPERALVTAPASFALAATKLP